MLQVRVLMMSKDVVRDAQIKARARCVELRSRARERALHKSKVALHGTLLLRAALVLELLAACIAFSFIMGWPLRITARLHYSCMPAIGEALSTSSTGLQILTPLKCASPLLSYLACNVACPQRHMTYL